jgi:hypothetical protein
MRSTSRLFVYAAVAVGFGAAALRVDELWAKTLFWLGAFALVVLWIRELTRILSRLLKTLGRCLNVIREIGPDALGSGGLSLLRPDYGRRVSPAPLPENPRSIRAIVASGGLSLLRDPEDAKEETGVANP